MVEIDALAVIGHKAEERGDFEFARASFARGAELGCGVCISRLGYMYDTGVGGLEDKALAMKLYRAGLAPRDKCSTAANNIGILYRERGDHRGRVRWLRKMAAMNDGSGQLELAKCLLTGTGVRKDVHAALRCLAVAGALDGHLRGGSRRGVGDSAENAPAVGV